MDFLQDFSADVEFRKLLTRADDTVQLPVAALELARDANPALDFTPTLAWIDQCAARMSGPLALASSDEALLKVLADGIAFQEGITGSQESYDEADGSFLNRVIERKTGIPISLSVLYLAVAQRAGITLQGVAAPGHFLIRYDTLDQPLFIDPFAEGTILSFKECLSRVQQGSGLSLAKARSVLEPVGPRVVIIRMLNNLKALYARQENWAACHRVQHRLLALQPARYNERRDWGVIAIKSGHSGPGLDMLTQCLPTCPEDERELLVTQIAEARGQLARWN